MESTYPENAASAPGDRLPPAFAGGSPASPQSMIAAGAGNPADDECPDLDQSQYWPYEKLLAFQNERLRKLLPYAYEHVPGYRRKFEAAGVSPEEIRSIEDLRRLPITTRQELQNNDDFVNRALVVRTMYTGGSTGDSLAYYESEPAGRVRWNSHLRGWKWGGYEPGMRCCIVNSSQSVIRQNNTIHLIGDLTEENLKKNLETVLSFKPAHLKGYVSSLFIFARYCLEKAVRLEGVVSAIPCSENLYDYQRRTMEQAFGCKVFEEYCCNDGGACAWECERREGLHYFMERAVIENVDGRMIVTDLWNYAMPFIRYENGDSVWSVGKPCSCGRTLPLIRVKGRTNDVIITANGVVTPSFLTHHGIGLVGIDRQGTHFRSGVRAIQYVQKPGGILEVNIVRNSWCTDADITGLERDLRQFMAGLDVRIRLVDHIPTTSKGKTAFIINEDKELLSRHFREQSHCEVIMDTEATQASVPIPPHLESRPEPSPRNPQSHGAAAGPKVSVLMCVHNGRRYLREALDSVHAQTYTDFELIVVDDGSTDGTLDILNAAKDARTIVLTNPQRLGLTKSLNAGLARCRGEYVARMDADDVSHAQRLEKQVGFLDENPECLAVGTWCNWIDAEGKTNGVWGPPTDQEEIHRKLLINNSLAHGSAMVRRSALERVGGYNEQYPYAQDYDLWLRLSEIGQVRNLQECLYNLRTWEGASSTARSEEQKRCARRALEEARRRRGLPAGFADLAAVNRVLELSSSRSILTEINGVEQAVREELTGYLASAAEDDSGTWPRLFAEAVMGYLDGDRRFGDAEQVRQYAEGLQAGDTAPWLIGLMQSFWHLRQDRAWQPARKSYEPAVGILVPIFNETRFAELCFKSIRKLAGYPHYIVAVNNSTCDVRPFRDRVLADGLVDEWFDSDCTSHGDGLQRARPRVGRFRYMATLDSDAIGLKENWLRELIDELAKHDAGLVGPPRRLSSKDIRSVVVHPSCMVVDQQRTDAEFQLDLRSLWPYWDVGGLATWDCMFHGIPVVNVPHKYSGNFVFYGSWINNSVKHYWYVSRISTLADDASIDGHRVGDIRARIESEYQSADLDEIRSFRMPGVAKDRESAAAASPEPAPRNAPRLSVILTTFNRAELLEQVLAGFAKQTTPKSDFEVIVVDDGSTPPVREVVDRFTDAIQLKYLRQENSGLATARNAGIRAAEGRIVLFSDDDDVPSPELVAEHLRSHREYPDESTAVLGHLDWHPDLTVTPLMHYVTHVGGEYFGFDRLKDGQFYDQWKWWGGLISAKRSLLTGLDGPFDPRLRFGYEDTELACRLLPRQVRVLYNARARSCVLRPVAFEEFCRRSYKQGTALHRVAAAHPQVIIPRYHLENAAAEYKSKYAAALDEWAGKVAKFEALLTAERATPGSVTDRHLSALYTGYHECFRGYLLKGYVEQLEAVACGRASLEDSVNAAEAPSVRERPPARQPRVEEVRTHSQTVAQPLRIAFIDTNTPCFDMGSSCLRMHHIVKILVSQGHRLDYLYAKYFKSDRKYKAVYDGEVRFIRIQPSVSSFRDYLHFNRVDDLDCVWITNLWAIDYTDFAVQLTAWLKANRPQTKVIIDTMDLHYKKHMRRFELSRDPQDSQTAGQFLELEKRLYPLADRVLAVTEVEKRDILQYVPTASRVEVVPNIHEVMSQTPDVQQRRHMCFLGACRIRHNLDAIQWFLGEVYPLILRKAPDAEFHIMGHGNEDFAETLQTHPNVKVIGYVEDAEQAVAQYRMFVCPMIYGAGMKGKLGVAASAGTPFVTTTIGAEGFDFIDGRHCFIADRPQEFADKCVHLLQEDAIWERFHGNVRDLVSSRFSVPTVGRMIGGLLQSVATERQGQPPARPVPVDVPDPATAPKVSIVMACRNCRDYLPECLDSITRQTLREWELFLLDDGSTDDTRRMIEEYARQDARIRPFYFDTNEGPYVRRNFAIERAATGFIIIQDADDIMSPHKLEVLYNEIVKDHNLAVVGSFYRDFLHEFKGLEYTDCKELPLEHEEIVAKFTTWRHAMTHMSAIVRKEMFETIGPYDKNPFASDAFWFAKLGEYLRHRPGLRLKNVPEYLTLRRVHTSNQTTVLPTIDPRNRRSRFHQYCECKLRRIREKMQAGGTDIAAELRNCDCSDFLTGFKDHIKRWESEPLDGKVIPELLQHCLWLFNKTFYVTCVSMLAGIEIMDPNITRRYMNYDLLRAMSLFSLDMRTESRRHAEREIQSHNSAAARQFLAECLENDSPQDVQNWCAAKAGLCDLHMVDARDGAVILR